MSFESTPSPGFGLGYPGGVYPPAPQAIPPAAPNPGGPYAPLLAAAPPQTPGQQPVPIPGYGYPAYAVPQAPQPQAPPPGYAFPGQAPPVSFQPLGTVPTQQQQQQPPPPPQPYAPGAAPLQPSPWPGGIQIQGQPGTLFNPYQAPAQPSPQYPYPAPPAPQPPAPASRGAAHAAPAAAPAPPAFTPAPAPPATIPQTYEQAIAELTIYRMHATEQQRQAQEAQLRTVAATQGAEAAIQQAQEAARQAEARERALAANWQSRYITAQAMTALGQQLVGVQFRSQEAARDALAKLSQEFEAGLTADNSVSLRERNTGRAPQEAVPALLQSDKYAHYLMPSHGGGAPLGQTHLAAPAPGGPGVVTYNGIEYRPPQNPGEEAYAYYLSQVNALRNTPGASPGFGLGFGAPAVPAALAPVAGATLTPAPNGVPWR